MIVQIHLVLLILFRCCSRDSALPQFPLTIKTGLVHPKVEFYLMKRMSISELSKAVTIHEEEWEMWAETKFWTVLKAHCLYARASRKCHLALIKFQQLGLKFVCKDVFGRGVKVEDKFSWIRFIYNFTDKFNQ